MQYELTELRDMIMCYGEARGNGREARRTYEQRYPNREIPPLVDLKLSLGNFCRGLKTVSRLQTISEINTLFYIPDFHPRLPPNRTRSSRKRFN
ncbi:hypothetical protein L9F63_024531, partial [Diploptera punctata]